MWTHNRLALWSVLCILPAALFWTAAAAFTVLGDGYRPMVDAIAGIPPAGAWLMAILFASPIASAVLGTMGRMQALRNMQKGYFSGFVAVALSCVFLPTAVLALAGMR